MLWRFGLQHASNIDKLLDKEDLTLEEVLNDPDLLQEVREQNPKVITYLVLPCNLKQMVDYIATEEFFKFSKMASTSCEVLCSNSTAFAEALTSAYRTRDFADSDDEDDETPEMPEPTAATPPPPPPAPTTTTSAADEVQEEEEEEPRQHLLESLWNIMRLPTGQLDSQQATSFSRVMCSLLQRKPYETLDFIRAQDVSPVTLFLSHLSVSSIVDLLLKVISLEELENAPSIIAWLSTHDLIPQLVARLSPYHDPEDHSLAAQVLLDIIAISQCNNPAQPTIGTNRLIEELKSEATVSRLADFMLDPQAPHGTSTLINCVYIFIELIRRNYSDETADEYERTSVDLSEMMCVLAQRAGDLVELLRSPRSSTEPVPTTQGLREPLGFERLRICELFAELLHCSNMPRLNQLDGEGPKDSPVVGFGEGSSSPGSPLTLEKIGSPHDHGDAPVGQLLKWKLIEHSVLPLCVDLFFRFPLNNFLHSVVYDIMHQVLNLPLNSESNVALILVVFRDIRITSRIAQSCKENHRVVGLGGVRLGFMGHLTGIGEEVARLLELSGTTLEPLISGFVDGDEWLEYVASTLQECRDQPLGGERPSELRLDEYLDEEEYSRDFYKADDGLYPMDDEFIIKDEAIGPAERIGRYNSYQNEPMDDAETGTMDDFIRDREADLALFATSQGNHNGDSKFPNVMNMQLPDSPEESAMPTVPPRPDPQDCDSFQRKILQDVAQLTIAEPPALAKKGRVHELLTRESKQRSRSSSELDHLVPADLIKPADEPQVRRQRSRSQSAGVGVSRAMVIQAAVQGQFPFLDAKTCEFVGQLKSDSVTLGGAAASKEGRKADGVRRSANESSNHNNKGNSTSHKGNSRKRAAAQRTMAPAVDEDETVDWADFSSFNNSQFGAGQPRPSADHSNEDDIDKLSEMLRET
ncbi:sporulation-induced protein [Coemansia spiralis]|uniref:Sporulation-induced protein n=1 Tax=Coemansia spiralis TaxID=417178 RepID=A0A9W8FXD0_9FUNG|nr:sporulation-induced protein [Coemansia spiralis]